MHTPEQARELLERAARAAGYKIIKGVDGLGAIIRPPAPAFMPAFWLVVEDEKGKVKSPWNPLDYDGDALRLAVKLEITFQYSRNSPPELGLPRECAMAVTNRRWYAETPAQGDEAAATRLAIVRAAAEMAPAIPSPANLGH